ncbi:T9SS type A sorting domain-containing protein [Gelidibacter gilvus]|uniref:T9SS type A sorting domain-containing protein n=1 Tax=Gelidibacter gilvus TaxID=59602 RepID=A0A4Q0XET2_9FLAO|nr:T9SS type A sorting domain-containing protein [Gelidibacter gilvus]RXJ44425.1 T9SS type A sorting domain-containing protein [Gelidibacter gilvus]
MNKKLLLSCALLFEICFTSSAQSLEKTITVNAGTSVLVAYGTTLNAPNIDLKSTSDKYACLLLHGELATNTVVNYDRYVNVVGTSGVNGGNDLISLPVKETGDVTFEEFLNYSPNGEMVKNSDILPHSPKTPTTYAFGPYSNSAHVYVNYDVNTNGTTQLKRGIGYRAASKSGQTVRFTGKVSSNTETVEITANGKNYWNLIGNPYPTYIDSQAFLNKNGEFLDPNATAIYGYNSGKAPSVGTIGNFTIINNLTNSTVNIAPGQGFFIAKNRSSSTNQISFTTAMRTLTGTDDFILGRQPSPHQMLRIQAGDKTDNFATEIYFHENSTLGLDPGYDAEIFSGTSSNLMLFSHLVENNLGRNMAIQSLGLADLNDVIIPLGLKVAQGRQVTFNIQSSTLPVETQVYLEDKAANTFTLLNTNNYTFTPDAAISGSGRFFLRIGNTTLSTIDIDSSSIRLYVNDQTIYINGQLLADTKISIYDIQGRLVLTSNLNEGSERNTIKTTNLNSGIYVVKLDNEKQSQTKKVIIK